MLMKLFKKSKEKKKKPLSDKAKEEKKQKIKKIVKRVLDILVYGFAIFMIFGLLLGSCNSRVKVASAYYYGGEENYTSVESVEVDENSTTNLYYRYDINYTKTFPDFVCFNTYFTTSVNYFVDFVEPYVVDNLTFTNLVIARINTTTYDFEISGRDIDNRRLFRITNSSITSSNVGDIMNVFNGSYYVKPRLTGTTQSINASKLFYQWLTYYFGSKGFNNVAYDMPSSFSQLAYLFANSDNQSLANNYFFASDTFVPPETGTSGASTSTILFDGCFKCNGAYYQRIEVVFDSVYSASPIVNYEFPDLEGVISSNDEDYLNYWFIRSIRFTGFGHFVNVYQSGDYYFKGGDVRVKYYAFQDKWFGNSLSTSTPYRHIDIQYATDTDLYYEDFPNLTTYSIASLMVFLGDAYTREYLNVPTTGENATFTSVFDWLRLALYGCMPLLGYTLIPGISIGTLILIPVAMTLLMFVIKLFKR